MARFELTGKLTGLHRVDMADQKSPFVLRVELETKRPLHSTLPPRLSYEVEFYVDDDGAKLLKVERPIRIRLWQE